MTNTTELVVQRVIDQARWLVWKSATPEEVELVKGFKDQGYLWYSKGGGWVILAQLDNPDLPMLVLLADTGFGVWRFIDPDDPAVVPTENWRGFKSWDWKKEIGL